MMILILAVFAALAAPFDSQVEAQATCDDVRFQRCKVQAFQEFLNVSSDLQVINAIFSDYTIMRDFLLKQWSGYNGYGRVDEIVKACNGLSMFTGCMFGNDACLTPENLLRKPETDIESVFAVLGTHREHEFKCGAGLSTVQHGSLACLQQTIFASSDALKDCEKSFLLNVKHDATRVCQHRKVLSMCYAAPFLLATCRPFEDSLDAWWACEAMKRFGSERFPMCDSDVVCKLNGPVGSAEYLAAHHSLDKDGAHLLRAPDHFDIIDGVKKLVSGTVRRIEKL